MGFFPERMYEGMNWRRRHGEPKNRRQLFQCVFTDQFFSLIPVNLLYLVFWLPAIAWTVLCVLQMVVSMQAEDGASFLRTANTWTVGLIPCLTLMGPVRAGMALLMRNWAREEYTPVWATFLKGLRENWKQTIPFSLLASVIPLAVWSAYQMAAAGAQGTGILLFAVCAAAVLYLLAMQVFYVLLVTYDLRPRHHFRNAVLLMFMKLPAFLLIFLGSLFFVILGIVFTLFNPSAGYKNMLIPIVYYSTVGLTATELIYASFANKLCDDYFHQEQENHEVDPVRSEALCQNSENMKK